MYTGLDSFKSQLDKWNLGLSMAIIQLVKQDVQNQKEYTSEQPLLGPGHTEGEIGS